ncbi:DUF4062 domain-containing protein [uncultured Dokdonia sp.]|uniref:DUF4062 domain-containing protein n=1 Tax=uncultured Dokdonia sp. TaxID=575653 RepID=UPI002606F295|nr:DUF4062 domain-containing protein [uncultured Dokdonia sp.]
MTIKYQAFISSTYLDLVKERSKVQETILRMNHIPIGMEMFDAEDEEQWQIIKRTIDSSDYYILILGFRYGSVDQNGVSFTEKEYDYVIQRGGIPVLSFLMDDSAQLSPSKVDKDRTNIDRFRNKVMNNHKMAKFWKNSDELASYLSTSLFNQITHKPGLGWERRKDKIMVSNTIQRDVELEKLCGTWTSMGYNGASDHIYRGKIEVHFDDTYGYRVTTVPDNGRIDDNWEVFKGSLTRSGDQFLMTISNEDTQETTVYSFMKKDIPVVKKENVIILGVHLGFTRSKNSHAGVGIFTRINLSDEEARKILGENVNFRIDEEFKSGYFDYYEFDKP